MTYRKRENIYRQRERQTQIWDDCRRERKIDRQTDEVKNRQANVQRDTQRERKIDRQTEERKIDRQIEKGRHKNRQRESNKK